MEDERRRIWKIETERMNTKMTETEKMKWERGLSLTLR
jgi:hypothetical protein